MTGNKLYDYFKHTWPLGDESWDRLSENEKMSWIWDQAKLPRELPASATDPSDDDIVRWIDMQSPLVLMRLYKLLNLREGYRMGTLDHRIRAEEARIKREKQKQ